MCATTFNSEIRERGIKKEREKQTHINILHNSISVCRIYEYPTHFYRSRATLSLFPCVPIWNVNLMREWYIKNIVYACSVSEKARYSECVNIEQIEIQIKPFGMLFFCYFSSPLLVFFRSDARSFLRMRLYK